MTNLGGSRVGVREEPASGRLKGTFGRTGTTHQIIQIHCKSRRGVASDTHKIGYESYGWLRKPQDMGGDTSGYGRLLWPNIGRGRGNGGGGGPQATADDKDQSGRIKYMGL